MSRRSTPERIDEARRAATRNRLIGDEVTAPRADVWIGAWEAQAAQDGLERCSAYWEAGWDWIAAQRLRRVGPPTSLASGLAGSTRNRGEYRTFSLGLRS